MLQELKSNAELKAKFGDYLKENYGNWITEAAKGYSKALFDKMCECANNFADAEGIDKAGINDEVAKVIEEIYKVKSEAVRKYFDETK